MTLDKWFKVWLDEYKRPRIKESINKTLVYLKNKETGKCEFRYQAPKTRNSIRTVPLLSDTVRALRKHKMSQNTCKAELGNKWQPVAGFEELVFTAHFGAPIQETFVRKRIHCLVEKINKQEQPEPLRAAWM